MKNQSASNAYLLYGVLFGLMFPTIAVLLVCFERYGTINWNLIQEAHRTESLLWIIDTAPLFLGILAWVVGLKQDRIRKINNTLEDQVKEQTLGLMTINEELRKEIEDRKKKEKELIEARQKAEQGIVAKDQFLSNMSHEIRTPMNGILGMTDLLLDTKLTKTQQKYLSAIKYSAKSLLVIINEILDLSKINSEKLELERINFTIKEVFRSIENMFQFKASEKGIGLNISLDKNLPEKVSGDPVRFGQVLLNVVGNAVKFTDKGHVDIRCQLLKENKKGYLLEIKVQDTGIGIASEDLKDVFKDFSQANTSITRKYGGTGLGLPISKRLIELFEGSLEVESTQNVGSTFRFTIQLHTPLDDKILVSNRTPNTKNLDKSKVKVLLVEDNQINQMVAVNFLKKRGFQSDTAYNGIEAIQRMEEKEYDLVLMDVQMPEMDGLTATRHIRKNLKSPNKDVKIMAMTASVLKHEIDRCFEAGMDEYIPKPFDPDELYSKIVKLIT
ncbi:MAG: response regulator [Bacteroidota bacterium]